MHTIKQRPVVVDGEVVVRPMMYLAMSYDHRLIDGKDSVQFLVAVKNALEDPARLRLDGPPPVRGPVPGDLRIVSLNLANYFNGDGSGGGSSRSTAEMCSAEEPPAKGRRPLSIS